MYLLFAGNEYYPRGGWNDYVDNYLTLEEALIAAATIMCDWWHIVVPSDGIIRKGSRG